MGRRQKNANPSPIRRPGSIAQERLDKALQQNRIQMQRLIRSPSFVVDETVTEALSDDTQHALDTSELEQTILSRSQCSSSGSSSSTENHMPNDPPQLTNAPPPTNGIQQPIILPAAHKRCLLESTHPSDVHNYCVKPQGPLPNSNLQQTPPNNTFVLRTPSRTDIGPTHTEHIHASNSPFLYQRALSEGTVAKRRLVLDSPEYNSVNQTPKAKRFILSSNSRIGCRVNQDQAKSGDSSLVLLTKKFVELLRSSPNGIVNLNDATSSLGIAKRRLYDITNVLEGVELIRKNSKNKIQWTGFESSSFFSSSLGRFDEIDNAIIKQTLIDQQNEETRLDAQIEELKSYLNQSENQYIRPFTYVNYSDVSRIASFTDKTVIAIKAPATASVNVADPKHCFLMSVKSDSEPIHAFHCSNASTSNGTFRNRSINDAPVATRDPLMESPSRGLMTIFRDLSTSFYSPVKQEPMDLSLVHLESPLNKLNSKISNIKEDHKQTDYNFPYTDFPTPLDPPVIEDPAFSFSLESHEGQTLKLVGGRQTVVLEEHISILSESDSQYVDHATPHSGTAKSIADSILDTVDCSNLVCIGADSTNVNTGVNSGVIHRLEIELGRPLHWSICLLHLNELPLRHLFTSLDGATTGPHSFNGPIGKSLLTSVQQPIVNFAKIVGEPIDCDKHLLSSDQLYFFEIVNAVKTGVVPERFESRSPARLHHARWLTLANRVLRLYISTEAPSEKLILLATFIVNSYAVVWFDVKKNSKCWDAAPHYYKMIETSRFLPVRQRMVVQKVLERNSYPGHIESIILAMLKDNRQVIRRLALKRMLRAREENIPNRQFQTPNIRLQATSYEELIDWQTTPRLEPVLTKNISTAQISAWLLSNTDVVVDIEPFPCHNQGVERLIKIVTKSASKVYGHDGRDGYIRVLMERRKLMPHFETKSEFESI